MLFFYLKNVFTYFIARFTAILLIKPFLENLALELT